VRRNDEGTDVQLSLSKFLLQIPAQLSATRSASAVVARSAPLLAIA
jgi:hypothetical protein